MSWSVSKILRPNILISQNQTLKSSSHWSVFQKVSHQSRIPSAINLGPLFFLVYINDLPNGLFSNPKLFAYDTSIFSVVKNNLNSSNKLSKDLSNISHWPYQWKMTLNPDLSKQVQEVIFSRKKNINNHPVIFFNILPMDRKSTQKHLGLLMNEN